MSECVSALSLVLALLLSGCVSSGVKKTVLPPFTSEHWHVDEYSGHAKSSSGLEFGFGSEWMVTDTALIQTQEQLAPYPKLSSYFAKGISKFPEIGVDSIYFFNPDRGLLFVEYHQKEPLKPSSEISLVPDSMPVYSREYARIFGMMTPFVDPNGFEQGPSNSVYTNVRYDMKKKQFVLLQRIPYKGRNVAVFHICSSVPKRGKWWEEYPVHIFWGIDLGNPENIEGVSSYLESARTVAVSNLLLSQPQQ